MIGIPSNTSIHRSLPQRIFQTLSIRYLLALSGIALTILASNWFVKQKLQEQLHDSYLLKVASQQGILVQSLVKSALLLISADTNYQEHYRQDLENTLVTWVQSHDQMTQSQFSYPRPIHNSEAVRDLVCAIIPSHDIILQRAQLLLNLYQNPVPPAENEYQEHLSEILKQEEIYLNGMKAIVNQYDREVQQRVDQLISMQQFLMYLSLSIIFLLILFVFQPVARFIKKSLLILSQSRSQAKALATERHVLLRSLEESHKYLTKMHFAVEQATLFAKTDCEGQLLYTSPRFQEHLQLPADQHPATLQELVQISPEVLQNTLEQVQEHGYGCIDWQCANHDEHPLWLTITVVPIKDEKGNLYQYLFLCIDITEKKEAIHQLHIANRAKMKQKIREQRMRSVLVLQAQEEERKRIAMDLHDNVGQSLTALKYNVEALASLASRGRMREQLDSIGQLLRETIVKVRQTSFHLMPSILSDYGLAPVLRNLAQEMSRITGKDIQFKNRNHFNRRLDEHTETNLYRIVQESITNSLKYSQATQICISLRHTSTTLWVSIVDNGVGFEPLQPPKETAYPSGRGIGNMEERAKYLQGIFTIDSTLGKGTKIVIQVPLSAQKEVLYGNSDVG
uniref:histidine kinase n=1 Tax=Roseihalotalea indica TaxID=2867963 RepID=A0AA49GKN0_9BACT|nr:histidine kinase [Tunicatimonas sp. TK19036]